MPGPIKPDYGPTGCCRELALCLIGAFGVLAWAAVFVGIQVVRWAVS